MCRLSEATHRENGIPFSQFRSAYLAAPIRSQWPCRSSANGEIRSGRGLSSAVSRIAMPLPKDCRLPLSVMPYLLIVFSGFRVQGCLFDDVAAVFVGEGGFVFGPLVGLDFGDQFGPHDGA